jgi:outer membrane protein insertion porin family
MADFDALRQRQANGLDYVPGTYALTPVSDAQLGEPGFLDKYGDTFNDAQLTMFWMRSTLNRGVLADRGTSQRISAEMTLPVGDLEYFKLDYEGQLFHPLTKNLTLRLHSRFGYAETYGKTDRLPFFENFYGGGFGSVRGFERNSLGPRSTVQEGASSVLSAWDDINGDGKQQDSELSNPALILCQDITRCANAGKIITTRPFEDYGRTRGAFGGNLIMEAGAEILFPLPFIKDQRSVQTTLFFDAGNVFDTHCGARQRNCYGPSADQIKASVGLGLTWISSFGPMTFSLAEPISKENAYDRREIFQFSLGQTF